MIENYEDFNKEEIAVLDDYVTDVKSNVFGLKNLPEVVKGALFSKYSRSSLGLRALLLKDFIGDNDQPLDVKRGEDFYDRILDGYGDDSIGELGGAHLAIEGISMIAAKAIEDARIGGSPLEKSTRYVSFDKKKNGEYLFYREPVIMASEFRDDYIGVCNNLFETYGELINKLTVVTEKKYPKTNETSQSVYNTAIRAKVFDCLRGLLPSSALTNVGLFGNGRFFETLIKKLTSTNLSELQDIGRKGLNQLNKIIPSFIRKGDESHKHYKSYKNFINKTNDYISKASKQIPPTPSSSNENGVRLIDYDKDSLVKVVAAILFSSTNHSLIDLQEYVRKLPPHEVEKILNSIGNLREGRRDKSPRGLEHAVFTFEIVSDFGAYRDLQRHRMLTQERQLLNCDLGYYVPEEILGTEMEKQYRNAIEVAKKAYDRISKKFPEEGQYIVPMAYNIRWYFCVNLRSLQWLCELRSSPHGHITYRKIAQSMAHQVFEVTPEFKTFFKFVNFDGCDLGRLNHEIQSENKKKRQNA